jgi:hypothetical protein
MFELRREREVIIGKVFCGVEFICVGLLSM